ncbi:uncharacterized protein PV09_09811, partial [Verruconis gallopava]
RRSGAACQHHGRSVVAMSQNNQSPPTAGPVDSQPSITQASPSQTSLPSAPTKIPATPSTSLASPLLATRAALKLQCRRRRQPRTASRPQMGGLRSSQSPRL